MAELNWLKQASDKPLFENIYWSKPETKARAGKLLIVGGNAQGFKAPATAYNLAIKAGVGSLKVLLPESLKRTLGQSLEAAVYGPINKSGSFSREALAELLDFSAWSDLTMLAGDLGHNSETAVLVESFVNKYKGLLCVTGDSLDPFMTNPTNIIERASTLIVLDLAGLQKLVSAAKVPKAITTTMSLLQLVELLFDLTLGKDLSIITFHQGQLVLACSGQVSTTKTDKTFDDWPLAAACYSSVWWLQNKDQPFKAMTTALYDLLI